MVAFVLATKMVESTKTEAMGVGAEEGRDSSWDKD